MENRKSFFKEYTNREEALEAVRQMRASGIEDIQTCSLKPTTQEPTDVGLAPQQKGIQYSLVGVLVGASIGFIVSNIIFLIPAFVLRFVHASLIGGLGVFLCTVACAALGFAMSFVYSKRTTREPRSLSTQNALGISVETENDDQTRIAQRIMKLEPSFT